MAIDGITLQETSEIFKINYDKKSANMYNSANVLQGRIKKRYDFTGSERKVMTPLSFSGGVGAGRLPKANAGKYKQATIFSKRVYARVNVEREAIHASANDKGAFVRATAETVKKGVESHMRNVSRILFGDASGVLGGGDGTNSTVSGAGSSADPFIITFPDTVALWKESNWEEQDYVQMVVSAVQEGGDAETNLLLVEEVVPASRQVKLIGASPRLTALVGSTGILLATDEICMQRSYNQEPEGLKSVLFATSGQLYGIDVQRRWQATQVDALGRGISVDKMNEVMLEIERKFSSIPNLIMCGYKQFKNFLALLEDQKVYDLANRNLVKGKELKGTLGFKGVEFMSTRGPIAVFAERFCEEDRVYFLNDNYIECHHRPGYGWFTEDKTVFLRLPDDDGYEARYGGYYQNYITPSAHGVLHNLAI